MIGIFNVTQIVSAIASSDLSIFLTVGLATFGAVVIAYLIMDYLHNKHMENLGKQLVDVATVAIQADQSMLAVAIAAMQGMDITDKVIAKPASSADKKAQ